MNKVVKQSFVAIALLACVAAATAQGAGPGRNSGQGRGNRQFGQMGRGGGGEVVLVRRKDVQTDLAVNDEQKKKIDELLGQIGGRQRGNRNGAGNGGNTGTGGTGTGTTGTSGTGTGTTGAGGNGTGNRGNRANRGNGGGVDREAFMKQMQEQREKMHKDLAAILNEGQMKRLSEISIQLQGNRAVLDADVQKKLNVTDEQKKKMEDLSTKLQEANRNLNQKVRNNEMTREEMQAARDKNNATLGDELVKLLTAEQSAKLKELQGKPFKAEKNEGRRGGGGR
jgi:hypothetical protein